MVNVAFKCKALLAKSVVFITDDQYKAKWVYLARFFIGRDLGRLHDSWGFLKSHNKPHAWFAPSYYQSVVSAAKDIKDVFITFMGKTFAVRVIYAELLIVSRVRVKSRILWQDKLGRTIPWSRVYAHSYRGFSTNQEHDVFFKVVHQVLKTGEYFSYWSRLQFCLDCSFCPGQLETLNHLFLDCPFAGGGLVLGHPLFLQSARCREFRSFPSDAVGLGLCGEFSHGDPETGSLFSQADLVCHLAFQEAEAI